MSHSSLPPERWASIDAAFDAALRLPQPQRESFLKRNYADDPELIREVTALLAARGAAADRIGESVTGFARPLLAALAYEDDIDDDPAISDRVGAYRILHEIGRGGMGRVYLAERADEEYRQRVAIKLVKRGMDTDEVLHRFRFERQVLATLQHPNIGRLLDGGATPDGRPYLVMEYVEGTSITRYCDDHRLDLDARLDLFDVVCDAVQHAHERLIVHRDLKPSNILVDPHGQLKLLDFGIAKLLADEPAIDSPRTRTGLRVLTPGYAAPEQIAGAAVTVATDVYSLGVLLYELLAGTRPFDATRLDPGERTETIPPSAAARGAGSGRGGASAADPRDIAALRGTSLERLTARLRGDLDTIVLKAMDTEHDQRYPNVRELADDIDRHRAGLPIRARPISAIQRAVKFTRRNRVMVTAAAAVTLSLTGGLGAAVWQGSRAAIERDIAQAERAMAEQSAAFLESLFAAADPGASGPERRDTLRIRALLELGAAQADRELADRPLLQARMQRMIGRSLRSLGAPEAALALIERALNTQRGLLAPTDPELAITLTDLGSAYQSLGQPTEAGRRYDEALAIRQAMAPGDPREIANALASLASSLQDAERFDTAAVLYDTVLAMHRRLPRVDTSALAGALQGRMVLASRLGDLPTSVALAREVLALQRSRLGDAHPTVAGEMNNLAFLLNRTGAHAEAESMYRQVLEILRGSFGPAHPNVGTTLDNLAMAVARLDRLEEADTLHRQALEITRAALGERHPAVAVQLSNHADLLVRLDRYAEAEEEYVQALAINREAAPGQSAVGVVTSKLGHLRCLQGDASDGERLLDDAISILRSSFPPGHPRIEEAERQRAGCRG
jgi:serine/threonine protein kinase/tetratricopeptide (TPR) repeat protein